MNLVRSIRLALFVSLTLGSAAPSFADTPRPSATLTDGQVVGVLPVLTTGNRAAAYERLTALVEDRAGHNGVLAPTAIAPLTGDQGFGFAGASTDQDIALFRLAYLIGSAPSVDGDTQELAAIAQRVAAGKDAFAALGPELAKAMDTIAAKLARGVVDGRAIVDLMRRAEEGIAKGPARAHGYLAAGLWLGTSMLAVGLPSPDTELAAMAGPLATLFEEDAELGGSDRKIAVELRQVATMLERGRVDLVAYQASLGRVMAVGADK